MKSLTRELAVVMPVYNEEGAIANVLEKWTKELDRLNIDYVINVYNDGSKDNTSIILKDFALKNERVIAHDKLNSGHGPTILKGYIDSTDAAWIFQIDSDDEMGPENFERLWRQRGQYDFLIGRRKDRNNPLARRIISFISRMVVRVFYGKGVWDVNSPYRLMRTEKFSDLFDQIPEMTFAPNLIVSGFANKNKMRILEIPVEHQNRQTGEVSIKKWKLFKAALKSFAQTIIFSKEIMNLIVAGFFILTVIIFFIRFYYLRYFMNIPDEADNFVVGWLISRGRIIYDTVFSHHMPLAYIFAHLVAILSPTDDTTHFRIVIPILYVFVSISFIISPVKMDRKIKYFMAIIFLMIIMAVAEHWLGHMFLIDTIWGCFFAIFLNILIIPLITSTFDENISSYKFKILMLTSGISFFTWVSGTLVAFYPFVISLGLLLIFLVSKINHDISSKVYFFLGCLIALMIQIVWLLKFGSIHGFIDEAILFNLNVYSKFAIPDVSGHGSVFINHLISLNKCVKQFINAPSQMDRYAEFLMFMFIAVLIFMYKKNILKIKSIILMLILLSLFSISLSSRELGGFHTAPFYIFSICIGVWCIGFFYYAKNKNKIRSAVILSLIILFYPYAVMTLKIIYAPASCNAEYIDYIKPLQSTIEYIKMNTDDQDYIASFVLNPILYLETKREPAHSGIFYLPWNSLDEAQKNDYKTCRELKNNMPKFIWLDRWAVWDLLKWSDYAKCIDEFVNEKYVLVDGVKYPCLYKLK